MCVLARRGGRTVAAAMFSFYITQPKDGLKHSRGQGRISVEAGAGALVDEAAANLLRDAGFWYIEIESLTTTSKTGSFLPAYYHEKLGYRVLKSKKRARERRDDGSGYDFWMEMHLGTSIPNKREYTTKTCICMVKVLQTSKHKLSFI